MDKDFAAQVMSVIKNNLFEIRKNILNLDDYVARKDYEELQEKYNTAQFSLEKFQHQKSQFETALKEKSEKISALTQEISKMYDTLESIGAELRRVEKENLELENSMEKILPLVEEQTAIFENYIKNYSELEKVYESYKKLSGNTKFSLEGIFGAENSPTSFLAGILQEGHLESLFDYVTTAINNGESSNEIKILIGLFEFAFDASNSGRREKIYERLEVSEGEKFDSDKMIKTLNSEQFGKVKKVLLVGYKYYRTDKIIRQSLVLIG